MKSKNNSKLYREKNVASQSSAIMQDDASAPQNDIDFSSSDAEHENACAKNDETGNASVEENPAKDSTEGASADSATKNTKNDETGSACAKNDETGNASIEENPAKDGTEGASADSATKNTKNDENKNIDLLAEPSIIYADKSKQDSLSVALQGCPENSSDCAAAQGGIKSVSQTAIPKEKRSWLNTSINILLLCVIAFLVFIIIFMNVFVLCPVRQESMYPTIRDGQRVLLIKSKKIENGDIFVFDSGEIDIETGKNKNLIKRSIAGGGDKLLFVVTGKKPEIGNDHRVVSLYRDTGTGFVLLDESEFINQPMFMYCMTLTEFCKVYESENEVPDPELAADYIIEVPPGCFYAMGDNRNLSNDSRRIGFIEKNKIVGRLHTKLNEGSFAEKLLKILYRDKKTVQGK